MDYMAADTGDYNPWHDDVLSQHRRFKACRTAALSKYMSKADPVKAHNQWNPYSFEGGTVAAVSGKDFVVVAADSRMSQFEVNIMSRDGEKLHQLADDVVLATAGFHGDILQVKRMMRARIDKYEFQYRAPMTADLVSECFARELYYRRFFPLFTGAVIAGIDSKGRGGVWGYDPVGCSERVPFSVEGTANAQITPFLDGQIMYKTTDSSVVKVPDELTVERAVSVLKDAFRMATERDTSTGDKLRVMVLKAGAKPVIQQFMLRED
jgi:20S proteasome subunit beta 6